MTAYKLNPNNLEILRLRDTLAKALGREIPKDDRFVQSVEGKVRALEDDLKKEAAEKAAENAANAPPPEEEGDDRDPASEESGGQ